MVYVSPEAFCVVSISTPRWSSLVSSDWRHLWVISLQGFKSSFYNHSLPDCLLTLVSEVRHSIFLYWTCFFPLLRVNLRMPLLFTAIACFLFSRWSTRSFSVYAHLSASLPAHRHSRILLTVVPLGLTWITYPSMLCLLLHQSRLFNYCNLRPRSAAVIPSNFFFPHYSDSENSAT